MEQGSDRIIGLLNSNLDNIIMTHPKITVNEEALSSALKGCTAQEAEFARYKVQKEVLQLRRQNVSAHLSMLAFMCKIVEATEEEEDRIIAWWQEKVKKSPTFALVDDEVVPTLTEFFESQLFCILRQFPRSIHPAILEGLRASLLSVEDEERRWQQDLEN